MTVFGSRWRFAGAGYALLLLLSGVAPAAGQHRWPDERQAGQFLCHADFSLDSKERLLAELVDLEQDVCSVLGAEPPREYVHLFLFKEKATYQAYLKQHFPRVPNRRALFIKARGPGMVFAHEGADFEIDVRHECTHALLHAWLPVPLPLWLDEGLAEYFEMPRSRRAASHPHHELIRVAVEVRQAPRLESLEGLANLEDMGRDEYRGAWAWVHFLLHGSPEGRAELLAYLQDVHGGAAVEPLSERLRRKLPDLERQFAAHFERPAANYLRPTR